MDGRSTSPATTGTIFSRTYDFGIGAKDNGNVYRIINNLVSSGTRSMNYSYDGLNRVAFAWTSAAHWGDFSLRSERQFFNQRMKIL